jgi:hypothetical protein
MENFEKSMLKCGMIWKIWKKGKSNGENIWKLWKKCNLNNKKNSKI